MSHIIRIILNTTLLSVSLFISANPAKPGIATATQPDGSTVSYRLMGDEYFHYMLSTDGYPLITVGDTVYYAATSSDGHLSSSGIKATDSIQLPSQARKALKKTIPKPGLSRTPSQMTSSSSFPAIGSPRCMVILAEYSDIKFSLPKPKEYFTSLLNENGFCDNGATGSARDYFISSSSGLFTPIFDVYGPVTLPQPRAYYGANDITGNDIRPHEMIIHACDILSSQGIDFSAYDCDNDGKIDNVYLFYAGRGESTWGGANTVWPHSWSISEATDKEHIYNGRTLDQYACSNETDDSAGTPTGIGTFCHEFSHVLGLPDLYPTQPSSSMRLTPDSWSVLDTGCYNNESRTPPVYSSFERMSLGWLIPETLSKPAQVSIPDLQTGNKAYMIPTENDNEFFLLENRQLSGWDRYLEGHGLLIWHIDYIPSEWEQNTVNNDPFHPCVDMIKATPRTINMAKASDPFPGSGGVTEFTASTNPRFISWRGDDPGLPLTDIREIGTTITLLAGNPDSSSLSSDINNGKLSVSSMGKAIAIQGTDSPVCIFDIYGTLIYQGASRLIPLQTGIYIVRISDLTVKVAVK